MATHTHVAFSKFKDPRNICILLPETDEKDDCSNKLITQVAEKQIVEMATNIEKKCKNQINEENKVIHTLTDEEIDSYHKDNDDDCIIDDDSMITDSEISHQNE